MESDEMRIKHGLHQLSDVSTSLPRITSSIGSTGNSSSNPPSVLVLSFGIGVRQLRDAQGWSQEQLAERSNLNRSYIGEIERGCAIASLVTVEKLASALKVSPSTRAR